MISDSLRIRSLCRIRTYVELLQFLSVLRLAPSWTTQNILVIFYIIRPLDEQTMLGWDYTFRTDTFVTLPLDCDILGSSLIHLPSRSISDVAFFRWLHFQHHQEITLCSELSRPCEPFRGANLLDASFHKTLQPCEFPCSWFIRRCQDLNVFHFLTDWVFAL